MKRKSAPVLIEVIPSRWDDEPIVRARSALMGLPALGGGLSLEFSATSDAVRFYVRASSRQLAAQVQAQLGAAYPQAGFREVSIQNHSELDPMFPSPVERMTAAQLRLQRDVSLPLKSDWRHERDPFLAPLAAAAVLGDGERVVSQLVLSAAPFAWADRLRAQLISSQDKPWRTPEANPAQEVIPFLALCGIAAIGLQTYDWYQDGQIAYLGGAGAAAVFGVPLAALVASRIMFKGSLDPHVIEEKLAHPAFSAQLMVTAYGPLDSSEIHLRSLVARVADTYRAFDHPSGQSLRPRLWSRRPSRWPKGEGRWRRPDILNVAELAGL